MNLQKVTIFLFVFGLNFYSINAQSDNNATIGEGNKRAYEAINAIKAGTTVVILETNAKKISSLVSTLRAKNLNPNLKKRLKDQLFDTVVKTERQNKYLVEYFNKHYTFSDLRFMYDTSMVHLKGGMKKGIFIGTDLYINETLELPVSVGGFIRIGRANNQGTGVRSMLVCDSENKVLNSPFPYNIILPDGDSLESERKYFEQAIERISQQIEKFYTVKDNREKLYQN